MRLPRHHVYYLTRPDFLKHDHIHRRKLRALREAGLRASLLSFVPRELYEPRQREYDAASADGLRRVVVVESRTQAGEAVRRFLAWRLIFYPRVVVQVLLCELAPLLALKRMPILGGRLRFIIEHEGDIASEYLYRWTFDAERCPPDEPPPEFKTAYDGILAREGSEIEQGDGVILVTPEHRALWEKRLKRPVPAVALPTFFEPGRFRFSAAVRERVRRELDLKEQVVLVYSGSVSMPWQRFGSICRFIAALLARRLPVAFLALIHPDGHGEAAKLIEQHGIKSATRLLGLPPAEMGAYLSAADAGLFLRHKHVMNRVVTSAKLGEYLAAGLPLVTTWACPYYRCLAEKHGVFIELEDSLQLPADFDRRFAALAVLGQNPNWRAQVSEAMILDFSVENNLMKEYVEFITARLQ